MKLFKKEKIDNKSIIHFLGLKIKYSKKQTQENHQVSSDIDKKLTSEQWGNLYNVNQVKNVVSDIENKIYSVQTEELLRIIPVGASTLEIGSGSGATSLCLAKKGCRATALDFSKKCLDLTQAVAKELNIDIKTICIDATKDLPFQEKQFDYIFHAGLLEHFNK